MLSVKWQILRVVTHLSSWHGKKYACQIYRCTHKLNAFQNTINFMCTTCEKLGHVFSFPRQMAATFSLDSFLSFYAAAFCFWTGRHFSSRQSRRFFFRRSNRRAAGPKNNCGFLLCMLVFRTHGMWYTKQICRERKEMDQKCVFPLFNRADKRHQ